METVEAISDFFKYIFFPNLGITLKNIGDHITIFGIEIKFYGMVITLGFIIAYLLVTREAKKNKSES